MRTSNRQRGFGGLVALAMAAALAGGMPPEIQYPTIPVGETDEEAAARREREARSPAEAIAAAQVRREKREARRQADRERTARQQGRTLAVNTKMRDA